MFSSPGLPLPPRSDSSPPTGSWGEGRSGPAGLRLVSYPLHQALGSCGCGCSLAVVLCLLVSLLGIVVFVVFSKIYIFLGGDSYCPTHAAILVLPLFLMLFKSSFKCYFSVSPTLTTRLKLHSSARTSWHYVVSSRLARWLSSPTRLPPLKPREAEDVCLCLPGA